MGRAPGVRGPDVPRRRVRRDVRAEPDSPRAVRQLRDGHPDVHVDRHVAEQRQLLRTGRVCPDDHAGVQHLRHADLHRELHLGHVLVRVDAGVHPRARRNALRAASRRVAPAGSTGMPWRAGAARASAGCAAGRAHRGRSSAPATARRRAARAACGRRRRPARARRASTARARACALRVRRTPCRAATAVPTRRPAIRRATGSRAAAATDKARALRKPPCSATRTGPRRAARAARGAPARARRRRCARRVRTSARAAACRRAVSAASGAAPSRAAAA